MTVVVWIWGGAILVYGVFYLWYVGFRSPLTAAEVDDYLNKLTSINQSGKNDLEGIRYFLENDTGKSFVIVNSIQLKKTPDLVAGVEEGDSSMKTLIAYHKPFMKMMFKRAGIGIFQGRMATKAIDVIGIENADDWTISAINRFRSRRDFIEIMITPEFHEKHELKYAALSKSIATPIDPWFQLGGVPLTVGLIVALGAALLHIFLV